MKISPINCIDFYKSGHVFQYPKNTTMVYSNFTARSSKHFKYEKIDEVLFFGITYFIKSFLIDDWNNYFFNLPEDDVIKKYKNIMDKSLGNNSITVDHIKKLHKLKYLPLEIKCLPEGGLVPIGIPMITIKNTLPEFYWLTNYIETALSSMMWKPITIATIAHRYKFLLTRYAKETSDNFDFVKFQAHDFSFRGMSNIEDAALCSAAHLLSFVGTDTVPAIDLIKYAYGDLEIDAFSVPATEHSVMCMGSKDGEFNTFNNLISNIYPNGIVSIVSDTWDLWKVLTEYLPKLKEKIMSRDGKIVIRPDSGNPKYIICGNPNGGNYNEKRGVIQILWDIFGGTINSKGFKVLNPKIGCIYGDSITLEIANEILSTLKLNGFSSENIVFGIGSFTYQYVTRDTFGMAMKSTAGIVNNEIINIFKDPITDDGTKKSLKGFIRIEKNTFGKYFALDEQSKEEEKLGELKTIFLNGDFLSNKKFNEIKKY